MKAEVLARLELLAEHFDVDVPEELYKQSGGPVSRHEQFHLGTSMLLDSILEKMGFAKPVEKATDDEQSELD